MTVALRGVTFTALPAVLIIGGWMVFNYIQVGYPGVSSLGGYSLTYHTGAWVEKAPPGYETIRDIYLRHRAEQISLTGFQEGTIYRARRDLLSAYDMEELRLLRKLTDLSWRLILDDPGAYTVSVARSLVKFWLPTWITDEGGIRAVLGGGISLSLILLGSYMFFYLLMVGSFLLYPFLTIIPHFRAAIEKMTPGGWRLWIVFAVVWGAAFFQAAVVSGASNRFKQPVEPLVLGVGAVLIWFSIAKWTGRRTLRPIDTPTKGH